MKTPLVSICLPNLNTRPFLEERMASIFAQTFTDWELIISDNYSDDGAWEFFQQFKSDPRVKLSQAPRRGIYANWNECLQRATGRYAYMATSDDTEDPRLLERLVEPLESYPNIHLACCDFQPIDIQGHPIDPKALETARRFFGEWMERPCIRNGQTEFLVLASLGLTWHTENALLFRRSLLDRIGLFDMDMGWVGDAAWNLRALLCTDVAYVPGRLARWRIHPTQATPGAPKIDQIRTATMCLVRTLDRCESQLPDHWKSVPGWREKIEQVGRWEYLDSYNLFRGFAWRHPLQFLRNAAKALFAEPGFLASQILRGFAWNPKFSPDRITIAHELIHTFQSPWPPRPMALPSRGDSL